MLHLQQNFNYFRCTQKWRHSVAVVRTVPTHLEVYSLHSTLTFGVNVSMNGCLSLHISPNMSW